MRGPEENAKSTELEGPDSEGNTCIQSTSRRDPSSSPPCKRLKQGVINFQSVPKQSLPSSVMLAESYTEPGEECTSKVGGLVMASASPTHKEDIIISECDDDDDDLMIVDAKETDRSSPKSQASPSQDNSNNNHQTVLSSAEKKKRKEERQNLKEAKKKEREEKIKLREQARAVKEMERLKAKQKKEQEKKEKLAEKERKEKDRLEKKMKEEKEKQEKKEKREEERRKKEEEQNAKLEEKRKKEEEKKQQEEEMERKKLKARNSFKSFFTKTPLATPKTLPKSILKFEPFEIKPNMRLAPRFRSEICKESKEKLDVDLKEQAKSDLYLQNLQARKPLQPYTRVRRRKSTKTSEMDTTPISTNATIIEVIDDEEEDDNIESSSVIEVPDDDKKTAYMKAIFLKFYENNRPPYYGTQRKRSKIISPKNPYKKDEAMLNYEVDSDDEWEEEEPGESLSDSEPEDNNEEENEDCDEEDEDGWMVPHGYLSDDEGIHGDDEEQENNTVAKKEQQLAKVKAWEAELKKKCKVMKPVCIGCVWDDQKEINDVLKRFEACLLVDGPSISVSLPTSVTLDDVQKGDASLFTSPDTCASTAMLVPEEAMPYLIQLIHGNTDGLDKLVNIFLPYWSDKCNYSGDNTPLKGKRNISKRQLNKKIRAIAKKETRSFDKPRWFVKADVLASYGLEDLKAESEVRHPINGSVTHSDIKQFKRTGPEFTGPNTLPVNNTYQLVEPIHSNVSAPKRRINLQRVMPVENMSNTAVSVSIQSPMECCETKITNKHSSVYPNQAQPFQDTNHEMLNKHAELQLGTFKRQISSPENTVRESKVLKIEDNTMNNSNFNNFAVSC